MSFWDTEWGGVLIPTTVEVFEKISPAPNQLREFQPGDRIELQGTLALEFDINGGAPQSIPISVTFEFFESGFSLEGQPLLALRIAIDGFGSGTSHYLQQANGTFWEVVIDDNWLFDQDKQSFGVLFIPSPLEPFTNQIVNFAELDGDDINSPIEAGRRSIFVREKERITVPLGTFDAYQVINDDTTEIVGCCGETTEYEETNWVVPDAGFVKIQATIWEYKSGVLQTRDSIFVEAVNKNF